ncbi:MAG TPA: hypothetical protein VK461_10305, partial [Acidimicrobiales bacterium]|nr:hypothetical protein [Acidimicrobiales bacterium]
VFLGLTAGFGLALVAVTTLGPTPELEPGPVRAAVVSCVLGAIAGLVIVGLVTTVLSARSVDVRPRHHWLRWVPWEVVLVALAVASYARLDRAGGVRLVGAEAQGGDLLAQAFPLLALGAVLALLARPARWLLTRSRSRGRWLPVPLLVGVRRLSADPGVTVLAALAIALVIGSVTLSSSLTNSASAMLRQKASTFLGSDVTVSVEASETLPSSLASQATIVERASTHAGDESVDVLGVDPGTFARANAQRPSDRDVNALMTRLSGADSSEAVPAIVAHGSLPSATLADATRATITISPVASAAWFPGYHNGATMVVVDRRLLDKTDIGLATEVWIHDPPPNAVEALQASGWVVLGSRTVDDVFDATSFLTVRWSYAVLTAFGVLIAIVVVVAQVLVLDARRRSRESASVVGRRMGIGLQDEAVAIFVELAVPFAVGAAIGITAAIAIVHLAIRHLDTLRNLEPPGAVVVDLASMGGALAIGVVALVALALIGTITVARVDPMEAMRSAE